MPDLQTPRSPSSRTPSPTAKPESPESDIDIAIDTDSQVSGSNRHDNNGHDGIELNLSDHEPDSPGSVAPESTHKSPSGPQSSQQPNMGSKPVSFSFPGLPSTRPGSMSVLQAPRADSQPSKPLKKGQSIQKWESEEWEEIEFDTDEENMSMAVMMKLANELSLLKSFLELYNKFNNHLGEIASGPRHKGFLLLISNTITRIESHTTHLRTLRDEYQLGNQDPGTMEFIAEKIYLLFKTRRLSLWEVLKEKVDMTDDAAKAIWLRKKKDVVEGVLGRLFTYLEELGKEEEWMQEITEMTEKWETRWKTYAAMDKEDLKDLRLIVEVAKTHDVQSPPGRS